MNSNATSATCPICSAPARYESSSRDLMFDHYARYDYFKCTDCGSVFLQPMPDMETIGSFYPAHYSVFDGESHTRTISPFKQAILHRKHAYTHLQPPLPYRLLAALLSPFYRLATPDYLPNATLLDVGCGNGRYLSTMRTLGWKVQGVELSENGVKVCQASRLPVHHGDLASAAFPDDRFELITVRHVIEHVPDPRAFMAELARILKPGGRLVIETPNSDALGRQWLGANWFANEVPRHLILFNTKNIDKLANSFGLSRISLRLETTPKIFLNSVDYVIKNTSKPSKKIGWRRLLARIYVFLAQRMRQGDVIHTVYTKAHPRT